MQIPLALPILIPLLSAVVSLFGWRSRFVQRTVGVAGTGALLLAAVGLLIAIQREGIQASQMGAWPAPFGITLVADLFSAIMVLLAGVIGFTTAVYSLANVDARREAHGYYPLLHLLLMGVCGAFLTGDIFNMYVWFEVMLISSFVLMALGGERAQMEGAIKYVTLNLLASAGFLTAIGILYGLTGTLNMAHLAVVLREVPHTGLVTAAAMLFLVAFGVKAAIFPLFFWLPASYHTPPVAVSAVFAGLLTKVGVYALIRVFTLIFVGDTPYTHASILGLAVATMIVGVLGAVAQNELRRILSFHIISQIGYMILGLGLYTPLAIAGSIFYIAHHIIVKTNLFFISGVVQELQGTGELKKLGGLYAARPFLALLFLIPAFSLAGIPPLSGFFAKLVLVKAGLAIGEYLAVGVALAVGLLTLFSMTKIWGQAFWKPASEEQPAAAAANPGGVTRTLRRSRRLLLYAPIIALAAITLAIGLAPQALMGLSQQAAEQLMNPDGYIRAVLKER